MELLKSTDNIVKSYYVKVSKYVLYDENFRKMIKVDIVISQKTTGISSIVIKYLRILTKQVHIIYNGGNVCKF